MICRSTFIQIREAMINICPIGRDASIPERNAFEEYDRVQCKDRWIDG